MSISKHELLKLFPNAPESALNRLLEIGEKHSQSADDIFVKWESFALKNSDAEYTSTLSLNQFDAYLSQSSNSTTNKQKRPFLSPFKSPLAPKLTTPTRILKQRSTAFSPLSRQQQPRPNRFGLVSKPSSANTVSDNVSDHLAELKSEKTLVFNLQEPVKLADINGDTNPEFVVRSELHLFNKHKPYNDKEVITSNAMDARLEKFMHLFAQKNNMQLSQLANPTLISQSSEWVVGTVLRDAVAVTDIQEAVKMWKRPINLGSALIETCRSMEGGGGRVYINLDMVKQSPVTKTLFEGQIIALKGRNPKGDVFIVEQIEEMPNETVHPITSMNEWTKLALLNSPNETQLAQFVDFVNNNTVSAAVIAGPLQINPQSQQLISQIRIPLVLVPSPDDEQCDPVFPTLPYDLPADWLPSTGFNCPNPCAFEVNNLSVLYASAPSLVDIQAVQLKTKFHLILNQRRVYPIYPPPPDTSIDGNSLFLTDMPELPNILVLPGENGAEFVDGVLCVSLTGMAVVSIKNEASQVDFVQ